MDSAEGNEIVKSCPESPDATLQEIYRLAQVGCCVNGVAHDINNLLGVAMAYAELVGLDRNLPPDSKRMLNDITLTWISCPSRTSWEAVPTSPATMTADSWQRLRSTGSFLPCTSTLSATKLALFYPAGKRGPSGGRMSPSLVHCGLITPRHPNFLIESKSTAPRITRPRTTICV